MIMKQSSKYYVLTHLLAFASLHSATTRELEAIYLPQLPVINSSPHPYGYGNFVYPWFVLVRTALDRLYICLTE